jgi:DNA-binding protein HU-beta
VANYTKADLLADVAESAGVSKAEAEQVIDAFFNTVASKAKDGGKVSWPGFGSFSASKRAARVGRNPQTGAEIQIPASTALKFTAAKALKDQLNS